MKISAIIPARGGSKRIPNKNIVDLCGKPLLAWSIETAKNTPEIHDVWVSTEDKAIKEVTIQYGANVIDRPIELASDTASSESTLMHFLDNIYADIIVFMQATSPLTQPNQLSEGIDLIINGADSVLSVTEDVRFYWDKYCNPINYDPLNRPRSQDKEKWFKETGAFYIFTREAFLKSQCRLSGEIDFVVVPEKYSYEIDTIDDLNFVKTMILTT